MGLLDDAIREHLELKRRAGVDVTDVERREQEVLGEHAGTPPPDLGDFDRRAREQEVLGEDAGADPQAEPSREEQVRPGAGVDAVFFDDEADDHIEPSRNAPRPIPPIETSPPVPPVEGAPAPAPPPANLTPLPLPLPVEAAPAPAPSPVEPAPVAPLPPLPVEAAPAPPPRQPPVETRPLPPAGPATEELRLPPASAEPKDVLEETPDFLQETPEHDRLWFEHAPPQEFDFDK